MATTEPTDDNNRYYELARKLLAGTIDPNEEEALMNWLNTPGRSEIPVLLETARDEKALERKLWSQVQQRIKRSGKNPGIQMRMMLKVSAAAVLAFLIATVYFMSNPKTDEVVYRPGKAVRQRPEKKPNKNVILTLSDGTAIILDNAADGVISRQGDTKVIKLKGGQLTYQPGKAETPKATSFNTISTPYGTQYQVVLPDNSQVWLNAGSSLRFPTAFAGKDRNVQLTGEAYFEVAKNAQMPFIVHINSLSVTVLGTHFNVNAYRDESEVKTTLLEGAVKLVKGKTQVLLHPGQEGNSASLQEEIEVKQADLEKAIAWKNGLFQFNGSGIESIMRQLSKWYDVDVTYSGDLSGKNFSGLISRKSPLQQVLKMLELTNEVHFKTNGRQIIVSP